MTEPTRRQWLAGLAATATVGPGSHAEAQSRNYRLVYMASFGCGEGIHNFSNLRRADALPGVTVQYVQGDYGDVNAWPANQRPVGQRLGYYYQWSGRDAGRPTALGQQVSRDFRMDSFSRDVVLVGPNNRAIGHFDSTRADFVTRIQAATQGRAAAQSR